MRQKIVCNKGKCVESNTVESEFDSLFDKTNVVDQIQRDLLKGMF
jgi:hypothetical protein